MSGEEEWRPVVGWEGLYEVSSAGRVRSLDRFVKVSRSRRAGGRSYVKLLVGKLLSLNYSTSNGYVSISLNRNGRAKGYSVHSLVCEAFRGPRPAGMIVAHNDGNRLHNSAGNLRYATYIENGADAVAHGMSAAGERNGQAKLTADAVRKIRRDGPNTSAKTLAERFGVSVACIRSVLLGDRWAHVVP